jgi:hypothetical protein
MKKLAFTLVALSAISSVLALDAANANALFAVGANALPQSGAGFAYLPVDQPATRHRPVPASTVQVGRIVDKAYEAYLPATDAARHDSAFSPQQNDIYNGRF